MGSIRFWTMVMMVLVGCGCGDGVTAPEDLGEVCADFGEAFCQRADDCGLLDGSVTACVNDFFQGCCVDDGSCGQPVSRVTDDEWAVCLEDTRSSSCSDVANGDIPPTCLQL